MRRLFLHIGTSLDGYIDHEAGLPVLPQFTDDEFQRYVDEWHNSNLLGEDPATAIAGLKQQDGRGLALFAGAGAATSALGLGVVDELRIIVSPALVGGGTRLFDGQYPPGELRLTDTRRFASGALLLCYEPAPR